MATAGPVNTPGADGIRLNLIRIIALRFRRNEKMVLDSDAPYYRGHGGSHSKSKEKKYVSLPITDN